MQFPIAVAERKTGFSLASIWNYLRRSAGDNQTSGQMALMLPVRVECVSPWESWLVQHRLLAMGADWEINHARLPRLRQRNERCTPWNMRSCLHLVVKFSAEEGCFRRPCLDWATPEEFEAMQIPKVSGESILLDYRHIMPHPEAPCR